jgi:NAD(P)-dependent dehydrogenase (short-subunit alcohol dehydrogenase family)
MPPIDFAAGDYSVAMLARSADRLREYEGAIGGARAYPTDVTDGRALHERFARVRADLGPVEVVCHNAGNAVFAPVLDTTPEMLEQSWQVNTRALLLLIREAGPAMVEAGHGAIVVTGATTSLRGTGNFGAFASAKAGQRILAQAAARNLGPKGIHVGYIIVDGVIDMPTTRAFFPDRPDDFFLRPDAIADTAYLLAHQDRSAWTFELDVRPFGENW